MAKSQIRNDAIVVDKETNYHKLYGAWNSEKLQEAQTPVGYVAKTSDLITSSTIPLTV